MSPDRRLAVGLVLTSLWSANSVAADFVPGPRQQETVVSPNGLFAFDIILAPQWRAESSTGILRAVTGLQSRIVWQRRLPQPVRPRYALVDDDGYVILFDQFDNIVGTVVALLVDPQGRDIASLHFKDISRVAGVPAADIVRQAKHGAWIQTPPLLKGAEALVGVAGRTLAINMRSGQLRAMAP